MNNAELNQILKSAEPAQRPEEYWDKFPNDVSTQLNRPLPQERRQANWPPRLAWVGSFAAICLLTGILIGHRLGQSELVEANGQSLQNEKLIREVMTMFPNRVRALVKDESGMRIVLADEADVPASSPLWVKICQGRRCTTLVTFSGQEVEVAGQKLTVLADAEDGVILVGDRFAWASDETNGNVQDLRIQAKPLQIAMH